MRGVQVTFFVLGVVVLGTQSFRHVYVKWIEPTGSALDACREPVEEDIAASKGLDELVALYEEAHARVKAFEETATPAEAHDYERWEHEPYRTERKLREAVERWESQRRSVFELWFYWSCGLLSIVLGLLAFLRINRWLGMVGLITGFAEMAVWTSPLWRSWGPQAQFERLLTTKLVLSLVSVVLLVGLWLVTAPAGRVRSPEGRRRGTGA